MAVAVDVKVTKDSARGPLIQHGWNTQNKNPAAPGAGRFHVNPRLPDGIHARVVITRGSLSRRHYGPRVTGEMRHDALANAIANVAVSPRRALRGGSPTAARRAAACRVRADGAETPENRSVKPARSSGSPNVQNDAIALLSGMKENPFSVGTYHSKRATHKVNELGDIIGEDEAPENILEQPGWDSDGKLRFCVATVSAELAMPEAEVSAKLQQLFQLAPGIKRRVGEVKTADLVRMVASIPDVVAAFVRLREILPGADLGKIVESRPSVLLEDLDALGKRVRDLKEETPRLNWDAILTDFPQMFEIRDMAANARELRRKFPEGDATEMLGRQPTLLLAMQSGEDMIAYDHGSLRQVKATIEGDRTHDGW